MSKKKVFKIFAVNPLWDTPEMDFQCCEYELGLARAKKRALQSSGFVRVCIKQRCL